MTKNNKRSTLFSQIALAGLISTFGSHALAQQVTLQNNQLTISGGSGTTFSSQSPTISSAGVVQTIVNVPTTNGVGIPSFSFTMVPNTVPDGVYSYRVGVTFDDTANDRRLEAEIGTLQLTVSGGNIVSGTIPGSQSLRVLGRNGGGTLQVQINVTNSATNGPITLNGGSVSLNASNLITRIRNSHSQFDSIILAEFDQPATYNYRIAVQQTGTTAAGNPTLQFGTGTTFAAFPQVQAPGCVAANCVGNTTAFVLNNNELASDYTAAYTVTGSFNVVTVSSGGSSDSGSSGGTTGGTTGNVTQDTTTLNNTVSNIEVPQGTPPSTEVVNQINNAVSTTNSLLTNTASQLSSGTVSTTQALSTLTTVNKAIELAGTATQSGGTVDSTSTTTAITNIANVLGALATKGTLTDEEKTTITNVVTSTVTSAVKLITSSTDTASVLNLVQATTALLEQTQASSGQVSTELATQLKTLGETAGKTIVNALPESIRGNTDATSIDAIRTLVTASPTAKQQVIQTAPSFIKLKSVKSVAPSGSSTSRTLVGTGTSPIASSQTASIIAGNIADSLSGGFGGGGFGGGGFGGFGGGGGSTAITGTAEPVKQGLSVEALSGPYSFQVVPGTNFMEITAGSEKFISLIAAIRIVSDLVPNGNSFLPNGQALIVNGGYAFEFGGAPLNNTAFTQAITDAGYSVTYLEGGRITVDLGNDERFAGAFGFQNVAGDGTCSTVSFAAGTTAVNSPDYAFEMTCSNGVKQRIVPAVETTAFYNTLVTAGLEASTSKDTGIISISGIGNFKPSFFVSPLTAADTAFHSANQNSDGVAIRPVDANGDGKTDYEVLTSGTKQVVYGL